jgi:nucleoside diphosphate kinase
LVGPIISRFEQRGFKLVGIKMTTPGKEHLEKHYADLADKPFFAGLIECKTPPHPRMSIHAEANTEGRHELRPHLRHGLGGP